MSGQNRDNGSATKLDTPDINDETARELTACKVPLAADIHRSEKPKLDAPPASETGGTVKAFAAPDSSKALAHALGLPP